MTLEEKAKRISEIAEKIKEQKDLHQNMEKLLPVESDLVEVRIRGTNFFLSKALFITQHKKMMKDKADEIKQLEKDLSYEISS